MRKRMKSVMAILLAVILLSVTWIPAVGGYFNYAAGGHVCDHGYYTLGDRKWVKDSKARFYWRDPALVNTTSTGTRYNYAEVVSYAMAYWHKMNGNIVFNHDNSHPNTTLELWQKNNLQPGVLAETTFWEKDVKLRFKSDGSLPKNYTHVKIYISPTALNQYIPDSDSWQRIATVTHEVGHALGLSHRNDRPNSIMCQYGAGRTTTSPTAADNYSVVHLYPNASYK